MVHKALASIITLAAFALTSWSTAAYADTHWVNLSGSNEAPYTSYATGAHKIQDAIEETEAGDTVRIAAGLYRPDTTIFLKDSIAVIGAGADSTVVYPNNDDFKKVFEIMGFSGGVGGGITLKGCNIHGYGLDAPRQDGVLLSLKKSTTNYILENSFYYCSKGIQLADVDVVVANNYFDSCDIAVAISFSGPYDIHHNEIMGRPVAGGEGDVADGIRSLFPVSGPTRIHHNKVITHHGTGAGVTSIGDSLNVFNNVLVSADSWILFGYCACAGMRFEHNTIINMGHDPGDIITTISLELGSGAVLENNAFRGGRGIIYFWGDEGSGGSARFAYNNLWGLDTAANGIYGLYWEPAIDLDTMANIIANPMFTNDSTYHLQRGSPLVDAGNPAILDVDGSRSDIGAFGGPFGTSYVYTEEPPARPDTLIGSKAGATAVLNWSANTESDLAKYRLHREAYSGFVPNGNNMLAEIGIEETTYVDTITGLENDLFYVLTVVDTAGMESPPSNEVAILQVGILTEEETPLDTPPIPYIAGVYPNPFNTSTVIEYYIPDFGARPTPVQLDVYNIRGIKITSLVNKRQYPGKHQTSWNGRDDSGDPVSSGVYFARLTLWGYEFASSKKLVLQK